MDVVKEELEEFKTDIESLQHELDVAKWANMALENEMHEMRLEHEKQNKLISSSFFQLGLIQVKKNQVEVTSSQSSAGPTQIDWLDS
jgi:hypothetical protein